MAMKHTEVRPGDRGAFGQDLNVPPRAEPEIESRLWLEAETELVRQVARALCARHGAEIFGHAAITAEFLDVRERCFEGDARDAIALVRAWDRR